MTFFVCRCKAHAAVAHHHGGGAVPAAGCKPRIPCGLCVVVGVNVNPAGSEHEAIGIDDAVCMRGGGFTCGGDFADDAVFEGDVCLLAWCAAAVDKVGVSDDGLFIVCCVAHAVLTVVRWLCVVGKVKSLRRFRIEGSLLDL